MPRGNGVLATDAVFDAVRSAILRGELRPNERLIEMSIAEQLGTSRTPVREALQRLAAEGLIIGGRQGWVVKEFTPAEIREIFEVRTALEGYATALAATRATDEQLEALVTVHAAERALALPEDKLKQVELNDQFHDVVLSACGNHRLFEASARNLAYYFGYPVASRLSADEAALTIAQHTRIVDAVRSRDAEEAERAARDHVRESLVLVLASLGQPAAGV